ncbi:MAG: helix-turn-helix transcriptional regulator [Clostridia bacterium]|nr:helix-turn-helix transcriptional regulator [Clostridia bacterium]
MFFDQEDLQVKILDVVALDQEQSDTLNRRGYHALSLRLEADTRLSFQGKTIHAGSGSIGYFPANLSYRRQTVRDRMIVVHFDTANYFSGAIELLNLRDPRPVQALFEEALVCWTEKKAGFYYRVTGLFYEILALLQQETAHRRTPGVPRQILPSVLWLEEHFTDPNLSVAAAAARSHISEVYFRKLFKEAMNLSPSQYIIGKRIAYAITLLESQCLSVRQVAEQAGFSDPKYFSTVFRKQTGCSPRAYLYQWKGPEEIRENP